MAGSAEAIRSYIRQWSLDLVQPSLSTIPNACILHAYINLPGKKTLTKACRFLEERLGLLLDESLFISHTKHQLLKVYDKAVNNVRNVTDWNNLKLRCEQHWEVKLKRDVVPSIKRSAPAPAPPTDPTPSKRLRSDCVECAAHKSEIDELKKEISELKEKYVAQMKQFEEEKVEQMKVRDEEECERKQLEEEKVALMRDRDEKEYERKLLRQALDRRTVAKDKLKKERDMLAKRLKRRECKLPEVLSRDLKNERIKSAFKSRRVKKLEEDVASFSSQLRTVSRDLNELEKYVNNLECEREEGNVCATEEEVRPRKYGLNMRKVMYSTMQSKVPYAHAGDLIRSSTKELCGVNISHFPSPATLSRSMFEMSVLSTLQATLVILESDCATLCWDATSLKHQHINEVHVQTDLQTFTLSMCVIPGGRTADYVAHISSVVDKMASVYSEFTGEPREDVSTKILSKIKSTLSDRAIVNSAVVRELRALWNLDLVELHCNLHPLDGFSNQVKSQLKTMDTEMQLRKTGSDCCVANLLYSLSKMR